jgi:hypothetical protein
VYSLGIVCKSKVPGIPCHFLGRLPAALITSKLELLTVIRFIRMVCIWTVFSCATGYIMYKGSPKNLERKYVRLVSWLIKLIHFFRKVYVWFYWIYQVCAWMSICGLVLFVMEKKGVLEQLQGMYILCYGLYFGFLARDCAEMYTEQLTSVRMFIYYTEYHFSGLKKIVHSTLYHLTHV